MREKDLKEDLATLAFKAEADHEVQMARADLYKIAKYAIKMHEMLKGRTEEQGLEGWVQSKITKAADYIGSVYHNMDYEMKFDEVAEAKKAKPDFLDMDGDGNKKEPMKKAVKDKEAKKDKKVDEQRKETPDEYMKRTGKKPTKVEPGTGEAGKKAIAKFKKSLGKSDKIEKDLDAKDKAEKEKQDENLDEYKFFKGTDNNSIKEQDPNKLKVLDWIADRADGKEHFLSFYRKGAAWSGRLIFIKPDAANKFRQKVEANPDHLDRIKQALTSIETTSKLFSNLGIKHDIRRAD